jgi:hypothetical protein
MYIYRERELKRAFPPFEISNGEDTHRQRERERDTHTHTGTHRHTHTHHAYKYTDSYDSKDVVQDTAEENESDMPD